MTQRRTYEEIANDLARWIDNASLPPTEIHPVYAAHVLLCGLIEESVKAEAAVADQRQVAARLREYVEHKDDCEAWRQFIEHSRQVIKSGTCTCGLAALVAEQEAK